MGSEREQFRETPPGHSVQEGISKAPRALGHHPATQVPSGQRMTRSLCKVDGLSIIRIWLVSFLTVNAKTNIFPIKGLSKLKVYLFKFFYFIIILLFDGSRENQGCLRRD